MPQNITTRIDKNSVSATLEIEASPHDIFEFLRQPGNHAAISGDNTVQGAIKGPPSLLLGDRFGMQMKMFVPYRVTSKVTEFEQDRRIAWAHFGGHTWRWDIEQVSPTCSRVTETFDLSTARAPGVLRAIGFPKRHESNVAESLSRLAEQFK